MSASFRRPPIPNWKNSPIKTVGTGLRKVDVFAARPKSKRKIIFATNETDMKDILRDASKMFDDDEDHGGSEGEVLKGRENLNTGSELKIEDMALLFGSPDVTFTADEESSTHSQPEKGDVLIDGVEDQRTQAVDNLSAMLKTAIAQTNEYDRSQERTDTIADLAQCMTNHNDLADHVRFLTDFDMEFSGKMNPKIHETAKTRAECEAEILQKLEAYVRLPVGVVHAMVMQQHDKLVQMGIFDSSFGDEIS